jgi:hypothetical protein
MRIRLIRGIAVLAVALGALAFPSAGPARAGSPDCTGWTSSIVPPTTIRVYRTATKRTVTVPFRTYVEKVMAAEWGSTAPAAALRIGAVAVKQYAWYYAMFWRGGRDAAGHCFDVRDSSADQIYNPYRKVVASHAAAVAATWNVSLRKGERFFLTGYRPGSGACSAHVDGWKLYQRDAVDCVRRYGDLAEGLARRFFSSVSWTTPGAGDYTGDGRGDLAVVSVAPETGETTARVYTSDVGYRTEAASGTLVGATLSAVPADLLLGRAAGDVDGDGMADLVQLVGTEDGVALEVMKGSAAGFVPAVRWWSDAADPATLGEGGYRLLVTDFTGDGRADAGIVRIRPGTVAPPPPDPGIPPTDPPTPPVDPGIPPEPPSTSLYVAASAGAAFADVQRTWTVDADLTTSEFRAGDMNGDGLGDLAILSPIESPIETGGTALQVALASPMRSLEAPLEAPRLEAPLTWGTEYSPLDSMRILVGDPDRDGRDDLIVVRRIGDDAMQIVVYRSQPTGTAFSRRLFTGVLPMSFAGTRFSTADSTGDGRADLYALVNLGADAEGIPLGTAVVRLVSDGTAFTSEPWFSDAALGWETALPF